MVGGIIPMIGYIAREGLEPVKIGEKVIAAWTPLHGYLNPPQPVVIVRKASREEFISFWANNHPKEYAKCVQRLGPPPESDRYYEVATD